MVTKADASTYTPQIDMGCDWFRLPPATSRLYTTEGTYPQYSAHMSVPLGGIQFGLGLGAAGGRRGCGSLVGKHWAGTGLWE
jgi:hypothetical protein